jgi:hypothetical protein
VTSTDTFSIKEMPDNGEEGKSNGIIPGPYPVLRGGYGGAIKSFLGHLKHLHNDVHKCTIWS